MIKNLLVKNIKNLNIFSGFEMKEKTKKYEDNGHNVIHLELGEPDFNTPENIKLATIKAIQRNNSKYAPSLGVLSLRKSIAHYISKYKNINNITYENIVVSSGNKSIIFYIFISFLNPRDEVILPSPGFSNYTTMARLQGAKIKYLQAKEKNNFRVVADDLYNLITKKTKLIVFNSPNNPTGSIIEKKELEKIAKILENKNIVILSDEIYDRLYFDNKKPISIASFKETENKTIIVDGFSKAYSMTGWRLGYGVMPIEIAKAINPLLVISNSCTPPFIQEGGIEAYSGSQNEVKKMRDILKKRRDLFVNGLNSISKIKCVMPDGAFYAFPNFKFLNKTSEEISNYLLSSSYISCLPGNTFGINLNGYLRFSYTQDEEILKDALNRIELSLKKIK